MPSDITLSLPRSFSTSFALSVPALLEKIDARKQGFYSIFHTAEFKDELAEMKKFASKVDGTFDTIVVCGIGGSALGITTIYEALKHNNTPRLLVLENIDPNSIASVHESIDYKKTLFLFISKSGGTIETLAQYAFFSEEMLKRNIDIASQSVIITGKTGFLRAESITKNIPVFSVPETIGGRFSVLTAVGIFPALLLGFRVDELLLGAEDMITRFQSDHIEENLPLQFAAMQYESKKPIHVLMPYASQLRSLALWYAQLLAESTGKQKKGYTLLPALGVTDQHSQLQLFADGPDDKLIIFLEVRTFQNALWFSGDFLNTPQRFSFANLLHCEMEGTKISLDENNIANAVLSIEKIDEYFLGQLFLFFQASVAFLGELLEIDAFDQPGVERGKVLAKEKLLNRIGM